MCCLPPVVACEYAPADRLPRLQMTGSSPPTPLAFSSSLCSCEAQKEMQKVMMRERCWLEPAHEQAGVGYVPKTQIFHRRCSRQLVKRAPSLCNSSKLDLIKTHTCLVTSAFKYAVDIETFTVRVEVYSCMPRDPRVSSCSTSTQPDILASDRPP